MIERADCLFRAALLALGCAAVSYATSAAAQITGKEQDPLLLDVIASFNFPAFAVPAGRDTGERIFSEVWQVGLAVKAHFGLK